MNRHMISKWMMMGMAVVLLVPLTGCTESLLRNMWVGFGESIGGVPGDLLADAIAAGLGI